MSELGTVPAIVSFYFFWKSGQDGQGSDPRAQIMSPSQGRRGRSRNIEDLGISCFSVAGIKEHDQGSRQKEGLGFQRVGVYDGRAVWWPEWEAESNISNSKHSAEKAHRERCMALKRQNPPPPPVPYFLQQGRTSACPT